MARAFFPIQFPTREILFSRCKLCLRYTTGNFNENPSMRALENFCEHEQASPHLIFASNSSKGQILRALPNWMGPFDTPGSDTATRLSHQSRSQRPRSFWLATGIRDPWDEVVEPHAHPCACLSARHAQFNRKPDSENQN